MPMTTNAGPGGTSAPLACGGAERTSLQHDGAVGAEHALAARSRTAGASSASVTTRPAASGLPEPSELAWLGALRARLEGLQDLALSAHYTPIVSRQVQRRMAMRGLTQYDDYLRLVEEAPEERKLLRDALLIGSTAFFRDADVFDALEAGALDGIGREHRGPLKIWVPGCSTGEEAYSLAIVLTERLEARNDGRGVRMFATDLRESGVTHGRRGVYSLRTCSGISAARRARFFEPAEGGLRVIKRMRDKVLWGRHDVTRDPPFPALDLVSCRNVLLYFERHAQGGILAKLHFGLRPGGSLLLGAAESTRGAPALFAPARPAIRLFTRRVPHAHEKNLGGRP